MLIDCSSAQNIIARAFVHTCIVTCH